MRVIGVVSMFLTAGCDVVFGLEDRVVDAAPADMPSDTSVDTPPPLPRHIAPGDYDGDLVDNKDDPCPLIAFQRPNDSDGDGLPDACDPGDEPHCLVFLETFVSPLSDRWSSPWSECTPGDARVCSPQASASPTVTFFGQAFPISHLEARIEIVDPGDLQGYMFVSPAISSVGHGRGCALIPDGASSIRTLIADITDKGLSGDEIPDAAAPFPTHEIFDVRVTPTRCTRLRPAPESYAENTGPPPVGEFVGLSVYRARIALHWIAGYSTSCGG